jgi:hypothetical protein
MPWWQQPFFQVALPIIVTFAAATWFQNKRVDHLKAAVNRRLDDIIARLDRMETLLSGHDRRITALEERTSPLLRR